MFSFQELVKMTMKAWPSMEILTLDNSEGTVTFRTGPSVTDRVFELTLVQREQV